MTTTDRSLPLVIEPETTGTDLPDWAAERRDTLRDALHEHGGILFRGFTGGDVDVFRKFMLAVSGEPLPYVERSSPRHEVSDGVFTSTDHPADYPIYLHNEQSYNVSWPHRIFFHCVVAPAAGGGTPVADCRRVYQRISPATRDRLERRGYMYTRHFGTGFGLSWPEAFQTKDRAEVERYCVASDIEFEWIGDNALTTRQVRPVARPHPGTGEMVWFNHLTFFHVSTLDPAVTAALMTLGKDKLPNNTYYGDGADLEPEVMDELRAAYEAEKVVVPWQPGDVLMLDNMLAAHGREPFTPPRRIVVGMTDPHSS